MDTDEQGFKPPYMSFQTFWNFIDELSMKPLPPRIDRSLMGSKSGTDQANLNMALTSFGFTDADANVRPLLAGIVVANDDGRKSMLRDLLQQHYVHPLAVSAKNGTQADLEAAFRDGYPGIASADTRRKAITFFLHATRAAGIDLSPHFPQTRSGSGAPGAPKVKRQSTRRKPATKTEPGAVSAIPAGGNSEGEVVVVDLGTAGRVVIAVNVRWLELDDQTFLALRKAVTDMKALAAEAASAAHAVADTETGGGES